MPPVHRRSGVPGPGCVRPAGSTNSLGHHDIGPARHGGANLATPCATMSLAAPVSTRRADEDIASLIRRGFDTYRAAFTAITRRAQARFETRDWLGMQADARERLDLYADVLQGVVRQVRATHPAACVDARTWTAARARFSEALAHEPADEIAETFFNSVTRRVLHTVGVNPDVEFLDFRLDRVPPPPSPHAVRAYPAIDGTAAAIRSLLETCGLHLAFADPARDAELAAQLIEAEWASGGAPQDILELQMLTPVFFRRKGAYLVGRVVGGRRSMPLVLPIVHGPNGLRVDAVLPTEDDVSIVFSFTRSYFHADVRAPSEVIGFLRTIMPVKPVAELYSALGYHRHGKTEFYRDLKRHLHRSDDRFDVAPGAPGMVMVVFAMPGYDVVFKVIRDSFPHPKQTTPGEVKRRYELVFAHDRAGRLVDAQQFEGLAFPRSRFSSRLLRELAEGAGRTVRVEGDVVAFNHLYTERRVRPLDLFLEDAGPDEAVRAALDYGQAIRDLAATNVFPGDLLLKNFGVTRHGRVIFYDYDELRLLSECRFRHIPIARHLDDELSDEPWFHVGPDDVFPENLGRFIPFAGAVRDAYLAAHGALYTVDFWTELQIQNAAGAVLDIFPYSEERRLPI
jgi:isocitrate dehydrogenase kinase/phosphatase